MRLVVCFLWRESSYFIFLLPPKRNTGFSFIFMEFPKILCLCSTSHLFPFLICFLFKDSCQKYTIGRKNSNGFRVRESYPSHLCHIGFWWERGQEDQYLEMLWGSIDSACVGWGLAGQNVKVASTCCFLPLFYCYLLLRMQRLGQSACAQAQANPRIGAQTLLLCILPKFINEHALCLAFQ